MLKKKINVSNLPLSLHEVSFIHKDADVVKTVGACFCPGSHRKDGLSHTVAKTEIVSF